MGWYRRGREGVPDLSLCNKEPEKKKNNQQSGGGTGGKEMMISDEFFHAGYTQ